MESRSHLAHLRGVLKSDGKLIAAGLVLAFAIFAFDLYVRLGVAVGVPYLVMAHISLRDENPGNTWEFIPKYNRLIERIAGI